MIIINGYGTLKAKAKTFLEHQSDNFSCSDFQQATGYASHSSASNALKTWVDSKQVKVLITAYKKNTYQSLICTGDKIQGAEKP